MVMDMATRATQFRPVAPLTLTWPTQQTVMTLIQAHTQALPKIALTQTETATAMPPLVL